MLLQMKKTFRTTVLLATVLAVAPVARKAPAQDTVVGIRPTTEATEVQIGVIVINVDEIHDAQQRLTANVAFVAQWHDPRLAYDGDGVIHRNLNDVWNPRLAIVNRQDITVTMPEKVEISPDGTVVYRQRVWGDFSQHFELSDFPLDRQSLHIRVAAVGYSPAEVGFVPHPLVRSGVAENTSVAGWGVEGSELRVEAYSPFPGTRQLAGFVLEVDATRKLGYYAWKMLIPLILIVAMSWIVFWMDPEVAAPQISVSVTAMLTLIAYRFMVGNMLPQISYLTRLDFFVLASTVLVFLTIVEATVTIVEAKKGNKQRALTVDRLSRRVIPLAFLAVILVAFLV